ncbi:hypothetical protein E2C01_078786 [Portunus trituberculatus]|uniref:Uncharacterized protein n=1 Tax=Portunus trituberculatus TaxID=210409 RepID=A0A5B7IPM9_PORTR|nr:hypothetical protein [Portunus trituberculatus]
MRESGKRGEGGVERRSAAFRTSAPPQQGHFRHSAADTRHPGRHVGRRVASVTTCAQSCPATWPHNAAHPVFTWTGCAGCMEYYLYDLR